MTATIIPSAPAELEDMLSDQAKMQDLFKNPAQFSEFITNYARNVHEKDTSIATQVREEVQRTTAQWLKDNKDQGYAPIDLGTPGNNTNKYCKGSNPKAAGAGLNGLFPDVSTFLQNVWHKSNLDEEAHKRMQTVRNYSELVPDGGGFLVPEEFRAEILRVSLEHAIVRPRARVIPMSSNRINFPMIDSTSNVSSVFGGIVVYRTEEGAELTESAASFGSIKLDVTKQTALAHVTNELVKDWGAFGVFIDEVFPEAMAYYEDLDFLNGIGVGAPLGALNSANPALIAINAVAGQGVNTIVWENVIGMYARMLPSSLGSAVWIASPDTFVQLATMALAVGTAGSAIWLTNGHDAPQLTLLGRPVIMSEKAPAALGTQGDLSFVDFSMYLIGDRQTMTVDSSPHVKFTSDKTSYRVIQRNDGRPWLQSPITPQNNSASLSPFIQLSSTRT